MEEDKILKAINDLTKVVLGIDKRIDTLEKSLNDRIDALDKSVNGRIDALDKNINGRMDALEAKVDSKLETMELRLNQRIDELDTRLSAKIDERGKEIKEVSNKLDNFEVKICSQFDILCLAFSSLENATNNEIIKIKRAMGM